jgi:hypothetical protein
MWYRLSQQNHQQQQQQQQLSSADELIKNFKKFIENIVNHPTWNYDQKAEQLATLTRNTSLPLDYNKRDILTNELKRFGQLDDQSGNIITKLYLDKMEKGLQLEVLNSDNPTIVQKNFTFKDLKYGTPAPIGGQYGYWGPQDMEARDWSPGFEPIYRLGPDGKPMLRPDEKPIVQGLKYDGSKQTPKPTWNPFSIQAAFAESKVQFLMGGASKDHPITEQQKTQILQYLQANKNEKNILLPDKLEGLNTILKSVGHKADTNDSGGVLFVERA